MCLNVRQAVLDKNVQIASPGPAAYGAPAGIGPQTVSRRANAPSVAFGTAERYAADPETEAPGPNAYSVADVSFGKERLSQHRRNDVGKFGTSTRPPLLDTGSGPGPGSNPPPQSDFGRARPQSAPSQRRVAPSFTFGTSHNGGAIAMRRRRKEHAPGPGEYKAAARAAIGRQVESRKANDPSFSFGSGPRSGPTGQLGSRRDQAPGPGDYVAPDSVGSQRTSNHRNAPTVGFAKARRRSLSQAGGADQPAPNAYGQISSLGRQLLSRRKASPSFGFGSAPRGGRNKAAARKRRGKGRRASRMPGPGKYRVHASVGEQTQSHRRNAPKARIGSAKRPPLSVPNDAPPPNVYDVDRAAPLLSQTRRGAQHSFTTAKRPHSASAGGRGHSPGPGQYVVPAAMGDQVVSRWRSGPKVSFTSGERPELLQTTKTPAPGTYGAPRASIGEQVESAMRNPGGVHFGFAKRDGPGSSTYTPPAQGPGPGEYVPPAAVGAQVLSRTRSAPSVRFGSSKRGDYVPKSETPGPNTFVPPPSFGEQIDSRRSNGKSFTFGAR